MTDRRRAESRRGSDTDAGVVRAASSRGAPDRAVSPVIGAVLMFALLVSLLGVLQVTAVPQLTQGAEFQHNQQVQGDVIDFSGAVSRTAASGSGETVTVRRGVRYDQRLFLINPPPASGTLRTTEPDPVVVENAVADGETGDVWDGTPRTFADRALVYRPSYNEYDAAPRTIYRAGVVANEYEDATLVAAGRSFVDGRRVDLTVLAGEYRSNGVERIGVRTRPLSSPARTVTVTNDGAPIRVTVPTELPESRWEQLLETELVANGGHVTSFQCDGGPPDACGRLTVRLEPGVGYEFRLAQVGVGNAATAPGPSYLAESGTVAASVPEGTTERLGAEVRDRFDNPVGGVEVDATVVSGPGSVRPRTDRSGSDGSVSVVYEAPRNVDGPTDVTVELDFGEGDARTVRYTFQVSDADGSGAGPGGGSGGPGGDTDGGDGSGCDLGTWSASDTSRRLVDSEGCVWTGIDRVGRLELSDPALTPLKRDGQFSTDREYLRLTALVTDGSTRYLIEVTSQDDGLERSRGSGDWGGREVLIYRATGDVKFEAVGKAKLDVSALETWYQGGSLDLLDARSYENGEPPSTEFADFVRDNEVDIRIYENDGAVTLTAAKGGGGSGGGTTTSADRIEYVSGSGKVGNNDDELQFGIENTGTSGVTVTGFSIDYGGTNKIQGDGSEVRIDTSPPGDADQQQGYKLDGTSYSLDTSATIAGGETATITLANFEGTEFDSVSEASAADNDMTVTLTFADGSSTEFYFDVTLDA